MSINTASKWTPDDCKASTASWPLPTSLTWAPAFCNSCSITSLFNSLSSATSKCKPAKGFLIAGGATATTAVSGAKALVTALSRLLAVSGLAMMPSMLNSALAVTARSISARATIKTTGGKPSAGVW